MEMEKDDITQSKQNLPNSQKEQLSIPNQETNIENNLNSEPIEININPIPNNQIISKSSQSQNPKFVKFDIENMPLQTNNLRYISTNTFNNLNDNIKDIIFDPKYSGEERSKSAYSKKSFREKFESMKLKVPEIKKWNCDPTAEVIINNLEKKIDILTYENFLLTKKIRELISNNKELQLGLSQNIFLLKIEEQLMNYDYAKLNPNTNTKINKNNIKNKKKDNKNKEKEKDVNLYKEINKLKDENDKLKKSNENLAENNMKLNKIIIDLKKEMKLNKDKFEEELENNKNIFEQKSSEKNNELNNLKNINENENNNINNNDKNEIQNNSSFDMNKYLMNEEQYKKLILENEQLHKKLRVLLSIEDDDINKISNSLPNISNNNYNKYLLYTPINENNIQFNSINNSDINNNTKNKNQSEELIVENNLLKQKIKTLNMELNRVTFENNQKLLKIQEKLTEKEKNLDNLIKEDIGNMYIKNNSEQQLDKLLNEILMININNEDEENKKMINTLENIKNNDKKRISQCLIINNKIKSLYEENNLLHNQLLSLQKENNINKSINNNLNNTLNNTLNNINNNNPHLCFCRNGNNESYDYLINALKIKDEIIIKYKERNDDNENKYKQLIIENSKLKENNMNKNNMNEINYIKKEVKINPMKRERAEGLEDYLLDKIVNDQRQVLGERAPNFSENKIMSRSMQYQDEKNYEKINNRYNNYHYRRTRRDNYE